MNIHSHIFLSSGLRLSASTMTNMQDVIKKIRKSEDLALKDFSLEKLQEQSLLL